jgi:hypothetical protein
VGSGVLRGARATARGEIQDRGGDRQADEHELQDDTRHPLLALEIHFVRDVWRWGRRVSRRRSRRFNGRGCRDGRGGLHRGGCLAAELLEEVPNGLVRIETNLDRVRPHESTAENPARQLRNVVALEPFERANRNLGGCRNLAQRDALPFARFAEPGAEVSHGVRSI